MVGGEEQLEIRYCIDMARDTRDRAGDGVQLSDLDRMLQSTRIRRDQPASLKRRCGARKGTKNATRLARYRWFESAFLQQTLRCETRGTAPFYLSIKKNARLGDV